MKALWVSLLVTSAAIASVASANAAEIAWTNLTGGTWSAVANWNPNQVPTGADVATITNAGTYTVTLDVNATVAGLRLGADAGSQTLLISGSTLTVNGSFEIGDSGFLSVLAGTIGGTGNISVAGLVNVFGGSFTGTGLLSIGTNGQVQVNGNVNLGGRAIENAGHLVWTVGNIINGQAFTNRSSGSFQILVSGNNSFSCTQTSVNAGLIIRSSGGGNAGLIFPFRNSGIVQVQSGTVELGRGGNHTGSFVIAAGATLWLGNGSPAANFEFVEGSAIIGEGNVVFGQGGFVVSSVNVNGVFQVRGTTTIGGHVVNFGSGCVLSNSPLSITGGVGSFNTGRILSPSRFAMSGGTFGGTDSMTVTGMVTLSGGTLTGTGEINAMRELLLPGDVIFLSGVLNNAALATLSGALRMSSNSVLNNLPDATFNYSSGFFGQPGMPGRFNNAGLLRAAVSGRIGIAVPFNNNGTVQIQSGTFYFSEGGTHTGRFQVSGGATLELNSGFVGARHHLTPTSQIDGAGNLTFGTSANVLGMMAVGGNVSITGGTNVFSGSYSNGGTLSISGGVANFNTTQPITVSQLNVSGGTVGGSDPLIVNGALSWTSGTLAGPGPISAHGGLTMAGSTLILNGGTLNNFGAAAWNAGSIFTGGGSVISNAFGATFTIAFDGQTFAGFGGMRTFFNAGLLRKTGGAGTAIVSESVYNSGTIEARSGTLAFGNTFVQAAGTTLLVGGNLAASGPLQIQAGSLAGSGTVGANVVSSGRCVPGGSQGVLRINGDYTQTSGAHLDIELGGTTPGSGFDQLQVSGNASLGGSLNVTAINGFHPSLGQTFQIVTFAFRTGDFSALNDFTTGGLIRSYDASGLNLTASDISPALSIARQGQQVVIAWPTNAAGYMLQSTTNLSSTNWVDVVPVTNPLILTAEQQKQFFRLLKP